MADVNRYIKGDTEIKVFPVYGSDVIEIGDLLFWDGTNNAVRNAESVSGADYAAKKANFANAFVGVAMQRKEATDSAPISVATMGEFLYDCPSGAEYDVNDTVAIGNGTAVADQTVVKDATASNAIGRVTALKASSGTKVQIQILSKIHR